MPAAYLKSTVHVLGERWPLPVKNGDGLSNVSDIIQIALLSASVRRREFGSKLETHTGGATGIHN